MGEPSKEAVSIAHVAFLNIPWHSNDTDTLLRWQNKLAIAIDAHTAAKDAEIERWKREAMAARLALDGKGKPITEDCATSRDGYKAVAVSEWALQNWHEITTENDAANGAMP